MNLGLGLGLGFGSKGQAFTPAKLSPLFWFRGDLGITSDVNGVSLWADQSGHGYDVAQSTNANKPAYVANSGKGYIDTTRPSSGSRTRYGIAIGA